jgi:fumarate hydratase class II
MHIAVALQVKSRLLPALADLRAALRLQATALASVVKTGRTHLQDATPVTLGQEFGGYEAQLALCETTLRQSLPALHTLALGGTAVGTGLNTHPAFGARVTALLAQRLQLPLLQAHNLFAALAGHEALVAYHAALRMLAIALTKVACDIRLMGSGPRAGLSELQLPANEPGSSIMPGKVNPTQVEALTMVCAQVMGHDTAIGFAASQGQLELNVYKPLIALDALDSTRLLADAMRSFTWHCINGLAAQGAPDGPGLQSSLMQGSLIQGSLMQGSLMQGSLIQDSLMLGTALALHIGHEGAARVVQRARHDGSTLRDAALALQATTPEQFDRWVDPAQMLAPRAS